MKTGVSKRGVQVGAACVMAICGAALFGGCASQDLEKASATVDDVNKTMKTVSDVLEVLRQHEGAEDAPQAEDAEGAADESKADNDEKADDEAKADDKAKPEATPTKPKGGVKPVPVLKFKKVQRAPAAPAR